MSQKYDITGWNGLGEDFANPPKIVGAGHPIGLDLGIRFWVLEKVGN